MELILTYRNYGKQYDVTITYDADTKSYLREDFKRYAGRLRDERAGRVRDDSPILKAIKVVRH